MSIEVTEKREVCIRKKVSMNETQIAEAIAYYLTRRLGVRLSSHDVFLEVKDTATAHITWAERTDDE